MSTISNTQYMSNAKCLHKAIQIKGTMLNVYKKQCKIYGGPILNV